jgi:hypothetical protein
MECKNEAEGSETMLLVGWEVVSASFVLQTDSQTVGCASLLLLQHALLLYSCTPALLHTLLCSYWLTGQ